MWRFRRHRRGGLIGFILFILLIAFVFMFLQSCSFTNSSQPSEDNTSQTTHPSAWFSLNGYAAIDGPNSQTVATGSLLTEPVGFDIRPGYSLLGWSRNPTADPVVYWDFSSEPLVSNVTLYAVWVIETYSITFDLNGGLGTTPNEQHLVFLSYDSSGLNNKVVKPSSSGLTKLGYILNGWWIKDSFGNFIQEWNFDSDLPNQDITLYAGWGTAQTENNLSYVEYDTAIKITDYTNTAYLDDTLILPDLINGKKVLSIGEEAFAYYYNAPNIVLPLYLTTINTKAFYDCEALFDVHIPDSVTSIGKMAFDSCGTIYLLDLGHGLRNIGEMAFYGCENLGRNSEAITIPSSVLSIEKFAFSISGDFALPTLEFENGLIYIGEEAFSYGNMLTISLPISLETIGKKAFAYCRSLADIYIGRGVTLIMNDAFRYANQHIYNYLHVTIDALVPPVLENATCFGPWASSGSDYRSGLFFIVPEASISAYETADNWSVYYSSRFVSYIIT